MKVQNRKTLLQRYIAIGAIVSTFVVAAVLGVIKVNRERQLISLPNTIREMEELSEFSPSTSLNWWRKSTDVPYSSGHFHLADSKGSLRLSDGSIVELSVIGCQYPGGEMTYSNPRLSETNVPIVFSQLPATEPIDGPLLRLGFWVSRDIKIAVALIFDQSTHVKVNHRDHSPDFYPLQQYLVADVPIEIWHDTPLVVGLFVGSHSTYERAEFSIKGVPSMPNGADPENLFDINIPSVSFESEVEMFEFVKAATELNGPYLPAATESIGSFPREYEQVSPREILSDFDSLSGRRVLGVDQTHHYLHAR